MSGNTQWSNTVVDWSEYAPVFLVRNYMLRDSGNGADATWTPLGCSLPGPT